MIATCIALFLPGMYLALTLFHHEMIPTELLASLAKAREHLPFPTVIEILLMEVSFELIREAGIRVPGVIGQTLGIIGAIILGQAAVAAGLVSPVLIIVISITGLGSFAIPNFSLAFGVRISRFFFIFCGAVAGFYGIAAGIFIFGGFACSMKSFGVPYFSPVAPKTKSGRDTIWRMPAGMQKTRPDFLNTRNRTRMESPVRGWAAQGKKGDG
jgi:spore germination protein KA